MILIPSLLFLAQLPISPVLPSGTNAPVAEKGTQIHGHTGTNPSPSATPEVRITIVNAMSVPSISLGTSGTDKPIAYPLFPQGEWSAHEPAKKVEIHYHASTMKGEAIGDRVIRYSPHSSQTLLLTGDLSRKGPADKLPQLGPPPAQGARSWPPNFQFHVYPTELGCKDPCHYRIVNGMPSKSLLLRTIAEGKTPSRQLALLAPGGSALLVHQPSCVEWEAEIEGCIYPVSIMQEGAAANCLIPFFLRNGKPEFIRVFETP